MLNHPRLDALHISGVRFKNNYNFVYTEAHMPQTDLTWNTALLYPAPDSPELEADLGSFEQLAANFRDSYFEKVASLDNTVLLAAIQEYEALQIRMSKPFCYAHLLFAADSGNEIFRALSQRCSELGS